MTSPILPCKKTEKIMAAQQILFFGGTLRTFFWGGACLLYCFWSFFAPVGFKNVARNVFFLHVCMCVRLFHLTVCVCRSRFATFVGVYVQFLHSTRAVRWQPRLQELLVAQVVPEVEVIHLTHGANLR